MFQFTLANALSPWAASIAGALNAEKLRDHRRLSVAAFMDFISSSCLHKERDFYV